MSLRRLAFLGLAAAALACTSPRQPKGCHADDQCPSGSRCGSGVCGAAARPVAAVSPIAAVETYGLVTLDGSASHDAQGSVVAHRWTVTSKDAPCEPPLVASQTATAKVRFGCAGEYALKLVVVNDLGLESEALTTIIRAYPSPGASVVSAGPDFAPDHACSGTPLRCTITSPVTLSARLSDPGLELRWLAQPPVGRSLSLDSGRRVEFWPNAGVPDPEVTIESDGAGIAGDWIFRVEAADQYGVVGAAFQRVSVRNRPPVIAVSPPPAVPHVFDAARSVFSAAGTLEYTVSDPDGDPVQVAPTLRHVGDGGAYFAGVLVSGGLRFLVEVPYGSAEDALNLIGGDGLVREIDLVARDANDAEATLTVDILIGNRPPVLVMPPETLTVPHRFDVAGQRYVATATFGRWMDPDGDPLDVAAGAAPCSDLSIEDGVVRAVCAVAYQGVPAVNQLAGVRNVLVKVSDPWADAVASGSYQLNILNSPPSLGVTTDPAGLPVQRIPLYGGGGYCTGGFLFVMPDIQFTAYPTATDPDGDPVVLFAEQTNGGSVNPIRQVCAGGACLPIGYSQPKATFRFSCSTPHYDAPNWLKASDSDGTDWIVANLNPYQYPQ